MTPTPRRPRFPAPRAAGLALGLLLVLVLHAAAAAGAATPAPAAPAAPVPFPVRGLAIGAPSPRELDRFTRFLEREFAPRGGNTLILRVDFRFEYQSHPELRDGGALSKEDVGRLAAACQRAGIRVIPQINLLGHQSWAGQIGALLRAYPDFDETPWVKMPEKYAWPNPDRLYCKSYCPLHPKVHEVVFALVDELCDAFGADAFHAGMDEVFYLGEDRCPRCSGKDRSQLFAGEVTRIRDHLAARKRALWIWGDRLLDGKVTGLGEWEASLNDTHRAIDLLPRDVVICDWHYERAEPTAAYFALKGLPVVTCPWKKTEPALQQVQDLARARAQSNPALRDRFLGIVQTVWSGAGSFLNEFDALTQPGAQPPSDDSAARCFVRTFEAMAALSAPPPPAKP